jgi:L-rhamnose isomerase
MSRESIENAYGLARERYAELGVDTDAALETLKNIPISLHCWQGDDVGGFEKPESSLSGGGIQVTGNYPGKARTVAELRTDIEKAFSVIPGSHRLALHASYGEFGGKVVDRDEVGPEHFAGWITWARNANAGLDFNSTFFSHPLASTGFTLSSPDSKTRMFWIEHAKRCRKIGAAMGKAQGSACVHNLWIPDGAKDVPVDRARYRGRLLESLDEIFSEKYSGTDLLDSVEGKLFGIGVESFTVGSHEFYLAYAVSRKIFVTLDLGHYHPTESVADKISSVLPFVPGLQLHVSRGVRWDSDHVVILNDDIRDLAFEVIRSGAIDKIHIGLDFFDGTINRIGAWAIGARSTQKGLLYALLEPRAKLLAADKAADGFARLELLETLKTFPAGAVWDRFCERQHVPGDIELIDTVHQYERDTLAKRK